MKPGTFMVGLRVDDVERATEFYAGLGSRRQGKSRLRTGSRCSGSSSRRGCTITCEPMDEAWGQRVCTLVDPFGFEWEPTQQIVDPSLEEANRAVVERWSEALS